jgi:hypothetical protein
MKMPNSEVIGRGPREMTAVVVSAAEETEKSGREFKMSQFYDPTTLRGQQ